MATRARNLRDRVVPWYDSHRNGCIYAFLAILFGIVLAVAMNDRIQVEKRLDRQDEAILEEQRKGEVRDRKIARIAALALRLARANRESVRRLKRLENPTTRDLRRLFRGLFQAASPRELKRLVLNLRRAGVRVIGVPEGRGFGRNPPSRRGLGGGDRVGGQPGPPPGQPGP